MPSRVLNAVRVDDPREILSIGFLDVAPDDLGDLAADIAAAEAKRHYRIEGVIESTELRAIYEIVDDEDFTDKPHPFGPGDQGPGSPNDGVEPAVHTASNTRSATRSRWMPW